MHVKLLTRKPAICRSREVLTANTVPGGQPRFWSRARSLSAWHLRCLTACAHLCKCEWRIGWLELAVHEQHGVSVLLVQRRGAQGLGLVAWGFASSCGRSSGTRNCRCLDSGTREEFWNASALQGMDLVPPEPTCANGMIRPWNHLFGRK